MKGCLVILLLLGSSCIFSQQYADDILLVNRLTDLQRPWGAEFLSDGRLIVSEMEGTLKLFDANFKLLSQLKKPKNLDQRRIARFDNAGAFDVAVDPDFKNNHFIYWSYSAKKQGNSFLTVVRLAIKNNRFSEPETIFSATPGNNNRFHYGGALLFNKDKQLLVAAGERYFSAKQQGKLPIAQKEEDSRGKIWLIANPESKQQLKTHTIASGVRNVQSMENIGESVWFGDHGAIKGDELNKLTDNGNYGWPFITGGEYKDKDYSPPPITTQSFVKPIYQWKNFTMAPSGLMFYRSDRWPEWKNHLFVSGLSSGRLLLLTVQNGKVVKEKQLVLGIRQRDIIQSPNGRIFILSDEIKGRLIEVTKKVARKTTNRGLKNA